MDKLAMVKLAEVNGVIAGLVDEDLVKVASEDEFNALCDLVAENLDDEYDMEDVLNKTAEVVELAEALEAEMEKEAGEAEEVDVNDILAAYGHLTLLKEAEEVDDQSYEEEAGKLKKMLNYVGTKGGKAWEATKGGGKAVGGHIARNWGKYTAGAGTAGAVATLAALAHKGKLGDRGTRALNAVINAGKWVGDKGKGINSAVKGFARPKYDTLLGKMYENPRKSLAAMGVGAGATGYAGYKASKGAYNAIKNLIKKEKGEEAAE